MIEDIGKDAALRRAALLRHVLGSPRGWKERLVRALEQRNAA